MDDGPRSELDAAMARLADGDRSAFKPVFAELWPPVYAFCARVLGAGADAEDAAQQALEKVFSRASTYDRARRALPWAIGIAAWECRTIRKRAQRARREAIDRAEGLASADPSPEDRAAVKELEDAARAVLGRLSEADREALHATFAEDPSQLPFISGAALRKRRERALARLRELWRAIYGSS